MASTYFDTPAHSKTEANPLGVKGIDHIEFIVDDADQWRDFFVQKYGMAARFFADEASGMKGRRAHVVGQGRINFVLAELRVEVLKRIFCAGTSIVMATACLTWRFA